MASLSCRCLRTWRASGRLNGGFRIQGRWTTQQQRTSGDVLTLFARSAFGGIGQNAETEEGREKGAVATGSQESHRSLGLRYPVSGLFAGLGCVGYIVTLGQGQTSTRGVALILNVKNTTRELGKGMLDDWLGISPSDIS